MEIGFNNDVIYRGVTFHIQTEDHGGGDHRVSSQLFLNGAIIDTRTISYDSLIQGLSNDEERKAKIRKVMVKSHRSLYKRLFNGEYDHSLSPDITSKPRGNDSLPPEEFEPSQERVPEVAKVVEEDGKVTFTFDHGDQIDLDALSKQLSQIDIYGDKSRGQGGGGNDLHSMGASDLDAMFAEFGAVAASAPPPAPTARNGPASRSSSPASRSAAHRGNTPPSEDEFKVRFRPTGKRAFQGLIEPRPDTQVVDLVRDYLTRNR